jgi:phage antirepressor YoqD-like protein
MYFITKNGFTFLVMGYTGPLAGQFKEDYIDAFDAMAAQIKALKVPETYAEALRELADTIEGKQRVVKQLNQANEVIEENKPKAAFADAVASSDDSILIRELAKIISKRGFSIGEKTLFTWMRARGYLNKRNEPYQRWIHLFDYKPMTINDPVKGSYIQKTPKINGKGILYFTNKILGAFGVNQTALEL